MWRGVLLDVGRHFFPLPFILRLLDLLALYKMNRFHWHLTEDQVGHTIHSFLFCVGGGGGGEGKGRGPAGVAGGGALGGGGVRT
jgi:uncharacterized membrane protein YgcG